MQHTILNVINQYSNIDYEDVYCLCKMRLVSKYFNSLISKKIENLIIFYKDKDKFELLGHIEAIKLNDLQIIKYIDSRYKKYGSFYKYMSIFDYSIICKNGNLDILNFIRLSITDNSKKEYIDKYIFECMILYGNYDYFIQHIDKYKNIELDINWKVSDDYRISEYYYNITSKKIKPERILGDLLSNGCIRAAKYIIEKYNIDISRYYRSAIYNIKAFKFIWNIKPDINLIKYDLMTYCLNSQVYEFIIECIINTSIDKKEALLFVYNEISKSGMYVSNVIRKYYNIFLEYDNNILQKIENRTNIFKSIRDLYLIEELDPNYKFNYDELFTNRSNKSFLNTRFVQRCFNCKDVIEFCLIRKSNLSEQIEDNEILNYNGLHDLKFLKNIAKYKPIAHQLINDILNTFKIHGYDNINIKHRRENLSINQISGKN